MRAMRKKIDESSTGCLLVLRFLVSLLPHNEGFFYFDYFCLLYFITFMFLVFIKFC